MSFSPRPVRALLAPLAHPPPRARSLGTRGFPPPSTFSLMPPLAPAHVPVIDVTAPDAPARFAAAAAGVGCFYATGTGVTQAACDALLDGARAFFDQPLEVKSRCATELLLLLLEEEVEEGGGLLRRRCDRCACVCVCVCFDPSFFCSQVPRPPHRHPVSGVHPHRRRGAGRHRRRGGRGRRQGGALLRRRRAGRRRPPAARPQRIHRRIPRAGTERRREQSVRGADRGIRGHAPCRGRRAGCRPRLFRRRVRGGAPHGVSEAAALCAGQRERRVRGGGRAHGLWVGGVGGRGEEGG